MDKTAMQQSRSVVSEPKEPTDTYYSEALDAANLVHCAKHLSCWIYCNIQAFTIQNIVTSLEAKGIML